MSALIFPTKLAHRIRPSWKMRKICGVNHSTEIIEQNVKDNQRQEIKGLGVHQAPKSRAISADSTFKGTICSQ